MDTIDIGALVNDAARRYGVDPKLANAVVEMESKGNPNAYSGKAMGVMQLTPGTAKEMGVKDIWDPVDNINGGMKYLAQLNNRYNGDPRLVLAAYNAGPGAVHQYGGVPPYPETQNYVRTGMGMLGSRLLDRPQTPAPAQASAPPRVPTLGIAEFKPGEAPPEPAQPQQAKSGLGIAEFTPGVEEPSALQKAGTAFWQGIGGPTLVDIGKGVLGEVTGDQPAIERGKQALGNIVMGIGAEPGRIAGQLEQTGQAIREGDLPAIAYHTAGAIPFFGGQTQQVADAIARGDYAGAVGQTGAIGAQLVAGPALGKLGTAAQAADDAITRGAWAARNAIESTIRGTAQVLPDLPAAAAGGAARGVLYGNPILGAKAAVAQKLAEAARNAVREALQNRAAQGAGAAAPAEEAPAAAAPAALPPSRQLPAPAIVTPPPADTSGVTVVPAQYPEVEPGFTPPTETPGTATTPWPGMEPEAAKTPGQVYAESQGVNWSKAPPNDKLVYEHIARAQENVRAQQSPPQAATPQAPQTPQQIAQALKAEMEQSGTVAPPEPQPSFAETARAKKVDALFDVMTRNRIPLSMVEQFGPKEWDMLAKYSGVNPPSETTIGQLKQRLADYEKARNIPVTGATTPAEIQTAFEKARAVRAVRLRPPPIR